MEIITQTDYFILKRMAPGVFAAIAKPGTGAWSNAGFVDLGTELLVFDSFNTPAAAEELKKQAEKLTGKKVKYLVNSHYHGDHVFGNQVFEDQPIISTELTREWIKDKNAIGDVDLETQETQKYLDNLILQIKSEQDEIIKQSLSNQYLEMQVLLTQIPSMKLTLPSITFENRLVISGTERHVELYCFGGGHSPSDTFLYVPKEKAALMGDIVTDNLHLPIFHPEEFLTILESTRTKKINVLLPGHGDIGSNEKVETMIDYVMILKEAAEKAIAADVESEDFVSSFVIPEKFKEWKGMQGIKRNLKTVYDFYAKDTEKTITQSI